MLRAAIAVIAALELAYFASNMPLQFEVMFDLDARWFNILSALCVAVFAPLLAIAAMVLASMGRRLGLATALLGVAPFVHWAPLIAFAVGIMIYGL